MSTAQVEMSSSAGMPDLLVVTDSAVNKLRELIEDEGNPALKLRIFVAGGGCSGFQYGFAFEDTLGEADTLIERDDIGIVVDAMSYQYLSGAEIDYQDGLEGARFVIKNPNATSTCGCGNSFSV